MKIDKNYQISVKITSFSVNIFKICKKFLDFSEFYCLNFQEKLALVYNATETKKYPNECEVLGDEDLEVVYNGTFLKAAEVVNQVLSEYVKTVLDPSYKVREEKIETRLKSNQF